MNSSAGYFFPLVLSNPSEKPLYHALNQPKIVGVAKKISYTPTPAYMVYLKRVGTVKTRKIYKEIDDVVLDSLKPTRNTFLHARPSLKQKYIVLDLLERYKSDGEAFYNLKVQLEYLNNLQKGIFEYIEVPKYKEMDRKKIYILKNEDENVSEDLEWDGKVNALRYYEEHEEEGSNIFKELMLQEGDYQRINIADFNPVNLDY
ncbi:CLUMA_CG002782, isoform A [Clunio marinus]|uniref:CLUMA_CG002782, isoform A n=1 Tax=Clunio marinus TaxID=568069 RepID=A0A1J1HL52_9DIPT|nr:CLUMA_CG002782, isoform A [Clunio marinus]